MTTQTPTPAFGTELKRWRQHRRFSQLDLAVHASVSQRHLSFLETGRSRPSPEMIEHLSIVLEIPLRARNDLLGAAGFAAVYRDEPLDSPELANVRSSLQTLVDAHDPYPAYVVDRCWNLMLANTAAVALTGLLVPPEALFTLGTNVLQLFLHPDGARSVVTNWAQTTSVLLDRLAGECSANPNDTELLELYNEVSAYPGVSDAIQSELTTDKSDFLTAIHVRSGGHDLHLYTAISNLLGPSHVALEELRLETLLPANKETAEALRELAR